jgi:hypothetical protein
MVYRISNGYRALILATFSSRITFMKLKPDTDSSGPAIASYEQTQRVSSPASPWTRATWLYPTGLRKMRGDDWADGSRL